MTVPAARWTNAKMQVRIDATGKHLDPSGKPYPAGWVFMTVDHHGFMVDLSKIEGTLVDPTISAVTWGPLRDGADMRYGGCIIRQDGTQQLFWDDALLKPYLDAWRLRRHELLGTAT
jgi:hypothetical protein